MNQLDSNFALIVENMFNKNLKGDKISPPMICTVDFHCLVYTTGCSLNILSVVYVLRPLLRHYSAAIGCTKMVNQ